MRKVIVSNMVTLDNLLGSNDGSTDWHYADEEFLQFATEQLDEMDAILFGRVTYEGMASYWVTPEAMADDPAVAKQMNSIHKIVFSKTLHSVDWHNTTLIKDDIGAAVQMLKAQSGRDMVIFGSGQIVSALAKLDLIDEYRLFVNPVVLGSGVPLFRGIDKPIHLKLLRTRVFQSGVVLLYYAPAAK
jgi:dihydrofolate reductase